MRSETARIVAVIFSLLIVTGAVTPVVALGTGGAGNAGTGGDSSTSATVTPPSDASSLELRLGARQLLEQSELQNRRQTKLSETLTQTTSAYYDGNRTSASTFEEDRRVVARAQAKAPDATAWLVASDARLSATAVADARTALDALRERNVTFDEATVESDIETAESALSKGDARRGQSPVAAVVQYRRAWIAAQQALDAMDTASDPVVRFESRRDPVHRGNVTYPLNGSVSDVRPHELGNVTVIVNGEERTTANLTVPTDPTANATFTVPLRLDDRTNEITVTATDPARTYADEDTDTTC